MNTPRKEDSNYLLLADVMRHALRFYKLNRNAYVLLDVILDHSYRMGQPSARFESREALHILSALTGKENRLSEALNTLVSCRMCNRGETGKGPITLTPLPDWWNWALPAVSPKYADRDLVASLVGYCAVMHGDIWVAELAPRVHPVVQRALVYALEKITPTPRDETSVTHEDVASGSASSTRRRGRPPHAVTSEQIAAENEARAAAARATSDENQGIAESLFPKWEARRREPFLESLIATWGNGVVFRALQRAKESRKPITKPWGFLTAVCRDIGGSQPPRSV